MWRDSAWRNAKRARVSGAKTASSGGSDPGDPSAALQRFRPLIFRPLPRWRSDARRRREAVSNPRLSINQRPVALGIEAISFGCRRPRWSKRLSRRLAAPAPPSGGRSATTPNAVKAPKPLTALEAVWQSSQLAQSDFALMRKGSLVCVSHRRIGQCVGFRDALLQP